MFHRKNDPSEEVRQCELPGCETNKTIGTMYAIRPQYAIAGPNKAAFGCPEGEHFACCHEHAMLLAMHCLFEHVHIGPHAQYGEDLMHKKLTRIAKILNEPYGAAK
jgi:hypothetical protein